MKLTELFLDQLRREANGTRRTLERVPEGRNDWKPHEKSMPLGYLAALVAGICGWIDFMVRQDEIDLGTPSAAKFQTRAVETRAELLAAFEESLEKAREALSQTTDEHLMLPWRFKVSGNVVSEQPRYVMIRDAVFGHMAHHRGQLTVYLRLCGAAVPAIYGPSADEK